MSKEIKSSDDDFEAAIKAYEFELSQKSKTDTKSFEELIKKAQDELESTKNGQEDVPEGVVTRLQYGGVLDKKTGKVSWLFDGIISNTNAKTKN